MAETKAKIKRTDLEKATKKDIIDDGRLYGPFKEYQNVDTDYGKYAVSRGLRMGFVLQSTWNKDTNRFEDWPVPIYFDSDGAHVQGNGLPLRAVAS